MLWAETQSQPLHRLVKWKFSVDDLARIRYTLMLPFATCQIHNPSQTDQIRSIFSRWRFHSLFRSLVHKNWINRQPNINKNKNKDNSSKTVAPNERGEWWWEREKMSEFLVEHPKKGWCFIRVVALWAFRKIPNTRRKWKSRKVVFKSRTNLRLRQPTSAI